MYLIRLSEADLRILTLATELVRLDDQDKDDRLDRMSLGLSYIIDTGNEEPTVHTLLAE